MESLGRVLTGACALVFGVVMGFACSAPTTGSPPKESDDDDVIPINDGDDDDDTTPVKPRPKTTTTVKPDAAVATGTGSCVSADSDKCLACCEGKNPSAVAFEDNYTTCLTAPNADPDECKAQHLEACANDETCIANHECMRTAGCLVTNGCN